MEGLNVRVLFVTCMHACRDADKEAVTDAVQGSGASESVPRQSVDAAAAEPQTVGQGQVCKRARKAMQGLQDAQLGVC